MKNLLISSKSFVSLMSTINFSFLRLDHFIQLLKTSSVIIGLEFVFRISAWQSARTCSLCRSRRILICSLSGLWLGISRTFEILWVKRFHNGSHRSYMTDRQRLTWQQTFFKRVISLSTARWFFSLLSELWWRERSADGVVTDLRVMQVRRPRVAGLTPGEKISVVSGKW